jgi:hypothetical protein
MMSSQQRCTGTPTITCVSSVRRPACIGVFSVILGLAGCAPPTEPHVCTAIAVDALVVTVVDSASGQRLCDATVTVIDGAFTEALRPFPGIAECTYSGPTERAGLYEVRVTRSGYVPANMTNVRVNADECHVIPVKLTVSLRPAS